MNIKVFVEILETSRKVRLRVRKEVEGRSFLLISPSSSPDLKLASYYM